MLTRDFALLFALALPGFAAERATTVDRGLPQANLNNMSGDFRSNVRWGWGTNGCVGIPNAFAKLLFDQVKVGDKVVIVKGKTPQPGQSIPLI